MFGNIGKIFKGAISNAATWVGSAIGGAVGGPTGSKIGGAIGGKIATSLMTKKPGHGQWAPIDTSVAPPQLGEYSMSTYKMSDASAPDIKILHFVMSISVAAVFWDSFNASSLSNRCKATIRNLSIPQCCFDSWSS